MGVTSGTKLPSGIVVVKGDPQQMHKVRCMRCHGEAKEITRSDGKKLYRCVHCGREWAATRI